MKLLLEPLSQAPTPKALAMDVIWFTWKNLDQIIQSIFQTQTKNVGASSLAKVIINVVVRYHEVPDLIVMDRDWLFISKFLSLLYYFLRINKKLSTAFYP